jgi:hypothetical protein
MVILVKVAINMSRKEAHDKTNKDSNSDECKCNYLDIADNAIKINQNPKGV